MLPFSFYHCVELNTVSYMFAIYLNIESLLCRNPILRVVTFSRLNTFYAKESQNIPHRFSKRVWYVYAILCVSTGIKIVSPVTKYAREKRILDEMDIFYENCYIKKSKQIILAFVGIMLLYVRYLRAFLILDIVIKLLDKNHIV